jgi:predicted PurR-regulated permease PerM
MSTSQLMPKDDTEKQTSQNRWARARDSAAAIIGWLLIVWIAFWALGHVTSALLILAIGALVAYVLSPLVTLINRVVPRWLAIALVYLALLGLLGTVGYVIANTAVSQLQAFAASLPTLLRPNGPLQTLLYSTLHQLGVTDTQITVGQNQFVAYLQDVAQQVAGQAVPILTGVASALLNTVLILVVSVYLVIDGPRLVRWLTRKTPISQRTRVRFALELMDHTVGGYVRGELILASFIGLLVGTGMYLFQLPYAILLGVLAFVLEFIPFLGVFISGAACVLVALTQGFGVALGVLAFFVLVHVIEGDVVGPRIIGRVLGLHPVVAILALIVGADLFGFWGALFAAPVAGVVQALLVALWTEWREAHPEEFPDEAGTPGGTPAERKSPPRRSALFGLNVGRRRKQQPHPDVSEP